MIKVQVSDKLRKLNERREYKISINSLEILCQRLCSNEKNKIFKWKFMSKDFLVMKKEINIYKKSALPSLTAYCPSWAFTWPPLAGFKLGQNFKITLITVLQPSTIPDPVLFESKSNIFKKISPRPPRAWDGPSVDLF